MNYICNKIYTYGGLNEEYKQILTRFYVNFDSTKTPQTPQS